MTKFTTRLLAPFLSVCILTLGVSAYHVDSHSVGMEKLKDIQKTLKSIPADIWAQLSDSEQPREPLLWKSDISRNTQETRAAVSLSRIDPDAFRNMTELILAQGYPVEVYTVQTEDGFLLDLHRIPHGLSPTGRKKGGIRSKNKPVVFLQHGLLSSACDWVMNFADDSLGFILADAGYDVWMGNSRGNTYSCRHVSLKPNDERFWDWSFDEMARYDVPAFINFILNHTGETALHYGGHSQGTAMAFALFSQRKDMQAKIKLFVPLAPVAHITYTESPVIQILAGLSDKLIYDILGRKDFLPSDELIRFLVDLLCQHEPSRWLCMNVVFLIAGHDVSNMNQSRIVVYLNHSPAGASVKDIVHFAQVHREKKFMMYDYGDRDENMKHYHQPTPPEYNVSNVRVPIVAFTGTNDWLADPKDAAQLLATLPNVKANYTIQGWNHLDFCWAEDAARQCYDKVVIWLNRYEMGLLTLID